MFSALLQLLLTALGVTLTPDAAALSIAVAVLAVSLLAFAIALIVPQAMKGSPPHPFRAIGASTLLAERHPDAAGHPRPRAPGVVRAA